MLNAGLRFTNLTKEEANMSMHRRAALVSLVLFVAALPHALPAQPAQSLAGTWKFNAAKSKYDPANLALKSSTVTYTFTGTNVSATIDQVNAKGQKLHSEYTASLDGAEHPWKGTIDGKPNTSQDGVTFKQLDDHTYHVENKLKGKVTTVNHIVVAKDGKTRTVTTTGTNADGQKVHNTVVYEKQ